MSGNCSRPPLSIPLRGTDLDTPAVVPLAALFHVRGHLSFRHQQVEAIESYQAEVLALRGFAAYLQPDGQALHDYGKARTEDEEGEENFNERQPRR